MNLIVIADEQWGIGLNNALLYSVPEDMALFKQLTIRRMVIMGRKTLKSLPRSAPLQNRINVVLTRDPCALFPGTICCNTLEQLFVVLSVCGRDDLFVIGGQSVYQLLLDYCSTA